MYLPRHFEAPHVDAMHELMRRQPLATIVTLSSAGLNANHVPLHLLSTPAPYGTLQGHVARSNPLLEDLRSQAETLAIFHGPQHYISPSWYPGKHATGKAVPTWNYAVVHAYGVLRIIDDEHWLRRQLEALTLEQEQGFARPWTVADTPVDYLRTMSAAIVGIEMVITRLSGKWKTSQNQPPENRAGVVAELQALPSDNAREMAALVARHGSPVTE